MTLEQVEREHVLKVVEGLQGNIKESAKELGITPTTLYKKLHAYGEFNKYTKRKVKVVVS